MANQPSKYSKFLIGAASAALVASAVAPVASAADFKDTKGNTHEEAINALSDAGVISGYPDGSFLPNKTLTRSDVVKMMGKLLVSLGKEVPTDYKTNPRFTDQTSKTNDELLKYSALVKDNGVFNGLENGSLDAAGDITRENMALVLVRAYDAINKTDLVAHVKEQEFKKDVTDLATAKAEARPYIDVLDFYDITNPVNPTFNPKDTTTRGQFASFLFKTTAVEAPGEKVTTATKVESVTATNLKEVLVTFDGAVNTASAENTASYTLSDDNSTFSLKSAVLQADGKSVLVTLADTDKLSNQEEHTLTVNNVKSKDDTTKTVSVKDFAFKPVDAALPTLVSAEGLGNKAIKLTFSEPVQSTSTVADTFKLDGQVVSGILTGSGTRTLIIELFAPLTTTEHTLSVNNKIKDFADYNLVGLDTKFTVVEDKVAPTVVEVKDVTLESATVVFSEDVKPAEATNGANYYWLNGTTKHYANTNVQQIDGKTYKLTFSGSSKLPAVATDLYIQNVVDYSANTIANDTKVAINPVVDQTRPEVVSEVFNDSNELKLTFNKAVDLSTFKASNVVLKDSAGKAVSTYGVTVTEGYTGTSRTVTLVFSSGLTAGTYTVELSGLKDATTLQNTMLTHTSTIVAKDAAAPKALTVTGTANVYYVTFDKAMDITTSASILNPENYYLAYTQNSSPKVGKLPAGTNIVPVNGNKGVIITLPTSVTAVSEITVQGVKSAGGVYLDGFAKKFAGSDIVATFDATRAYATAKDSVYVKFNQPVSRLATIAGITVNGLQVTNAVVDSKDNTLVKLTLATPLATTDAGVTVNLPAEAFLNLGNAKSAVYSGTVADAIAPSAIKNNDGKVVVGSGITTSGSTVSINFEENVKSLNNANLKDNFRAYQQNGLELEYGSDFTVSNASALGTAANKIDLDFTGSSYTGQVHIVFDNANGNIVDTTAVKVSDGSANNSLAASGFDTRNSSDVVGTVTILLPAAGAPTLTPATQQGGSSVAFTVPAGQTAWLAPAATTNFVAGATMTKAVAGATSITAPATEGAYKLFLVNASGVASAASTGTLTVDNTAPTVLTAKFTSATELTLTFSENVNTVFGDFTTGTTSKPGTFTTSAATGSGSDTIVLTVAPGTAGDIAAGITGTVNVTANVKDIAGNSIIAVPAQAITSGF